MLSFLFSGLHPTILRVLDGSYDSHFDAIDMLPTDYQQMFANVNTCLQSLVMAYLRVAPEIPLTRSISQPRLSSTYIINPNSNLLRSRAKSEFCMHPYLVRKFLKLMRNNSILLTSFLVAHSFHYST